MTTITTTKKDSRYPTRAPFTHEDYVKAINIIAKYGPMTMAEAIAKSKEVK